MASLNGRYARERVESDSVIILENFSILLLIYMMFSFVIMFYYAWQ